VRTPFGMAAPRCRRVTCRPSRVSTRIWTHGVHDPPLRCRVVVVVVAVVPVVFSVLEMPSCWVHQPELTARSGHR
jgi:hypothetical protein